MLESIATILILLWLVGFIGFPVIGGLIHILLVIAIIMILLRFVKGKK